MSSKLGPYQVALSVSMLGGIVLPHHRNAIPKDGKPFVAHSSPLFFKLKFLIQRLQAVGAFSKLFVSPYHSYCTILKTIQYVERELC